MQASDTAWKEKDIESIPVHKNDLELKKRRKNILKLENKSGKYMEELEYYKYLGRLLASLAW